MYSTPRTARSAGVRVVRMLWAWRLAVGTRWKRALPKEVRTAVAASQRWYRALVVRSVCLADNIKHSWHSHSAIMQRLVIVLH